jgi:hypothetical protein
MPMRRGCVVTMWLVDFFAGTQKILDAATSPVSSVRVRRHRVHRASVGRSDMRPGRRPPWDRIWHRVRVECSPGRCRGTPDTASTPPGHRRHRLLVRPGRADRSSRPVRSKTLVSSRPGVLRQRCRRPGHGSHRSNCPLPLTPRRRHRRFGRLTRPRRRRAPTPLWHRGRRRRWPRRIAAGRCAPAPPVAPVSWPGRHH